MQKSKVVLSTLLATKAPTAAAGMAPMESKEAVRKSTKIASFIQMQNLSNFEVL